MHTADKLDPVGGLVLEHRALMRGYGRAQAHCSDALRAQAREIERLQAQAVRLRAAVILRETALAWAREDRAALEKAIPGLPRRVALAKHVDALLACIRDLLRERLQAGQWTVDEAPAPAIAAGPPTGEPDALEASLRAADLVICQTGCLSHGAFWRVQDHCKRTGKTCVMVEQPVALRIVRIHAAQDVQAPTGRATLQKEPST